MRVAVLRNGQVKVVKSESDFPFVAAIKETSDEEPSEYDNKTQRDKTVVMFNLASIRTMDNLSVALDHLQPATEAQNSLLADAKRNYSAIWQNRILMSLQGIDAVSWPLLYVVSVWTCIALFSDRTELEIRPRDHRRGGAWFLLRGQRDVLDSGTVATLLQRHSRLFGRHRPRRSRTRQALKEHSLSSSDSPDAEAFADVTISLLGVQ
jgi:hypothetical protein